MSRRSSADEEGPSRVPPPLELPLVVFRAEVVDMVLPIPKGSAAKLRVAWCCIDVSRRLQHDINDQQSSGCSSSFLRKLQTHGSSLSSSSLPWS